MKRAGWSALEALEARRALALGRAALDAVDAAMPAVVLAASLRGEAYALGSRQHLEDALAPSLHGRATRRATGGPAAYAGEGVTYVALALAHASVLMDCPPDRVLNRNVRPFLAALRELGGVAHYFGREVLSVERRPAALLGWTRTEDGRVLIEAFLGIERSFALADAELGLVPEGRMQGKAPITLGGRLRDASPQALARALAGACARAAGLACEELAPNELGCAEAGSPDSASMPRPRSLEGDAGLRWSTPRAVPIGFVRAGLSLDAARDVAHAALAGDFYEDEGAPERLDAALRGGPPTAERLRDALNATYGSGGAVIEGLSSLQPVLEAFLELAG
jgi:hypothetical protein